MVNQEHIVIDGRDFVRTYSDAGRYVVGGFPNTNYIESVDPAVFHRQYVEGDLIPVDPEDLSDRAEAYDILMGVSE